MENETVSIIISEIFNKIYHPTVSICTEKIEDQGYCWRLECLKVELIRLKEALDTHKNLKINLRNLNIILLKMIMVNLMGFVPLYCSTSSEDLCARAENELSGAITDIKQGRSYINNKKIWTILEGPDFTESYRWNRNGSEKDIYTFKPHPDTNSGIDITAEDILFPLVIFDIVKESSRFYLSSVREAKEKMMKNFSEAVKGETADILKEREEIWKDEFEPLLYTIKEIKK